MSPKVAVLLCASNAEKFIREAIESILNQTYRDFEFIIVENGSTDNTWNIIKSYKDSRIKAFQIPLRQLTFALNFGLIQTKAEYIARMDADDIAMPQRIAFQAAHLDANPDVAVLGTAVEFFYEKKPSKNIALPLTDRDIRRRLPFFFSICHPSVMFRRFVIMDVGGYCNKINCEDFDLWIRLIRDPKIKFANLPDSLLRYRVHSDQIKGTYISYMGVAGVLLWEALYQKSPRLFLACVFTCLKMIRTYR
jgi:O86/O127-antigen biosynthesis beta-1,3-galactosyltransferase